MTKDEATKWLDGTYDEHSFYVQEMGGSATYQDYTFFKASLSMGLAAKMKQAICVLQYHEMSDA